MWTAVVKLQRLHDAAVKAALRYERVGAGPKTSGRLHDAWVRAEERFADALRAEMGEAE